MSERGIDLLEAIEVHDHHGAVGVRSRDRIADALVEERAIGQQGQGVVVGGMVAVGGLPLQIGGLLPEPPGRLTDDPKE